MSLLNETRLFSGSNVDNRQNHVGKQGRGVKEGETMWGKQGRGVKDCETMWVKQGRGVKDGETMWVKQGRGMKDGEKLSSVSPPYIRAVIYKDVIFELPLEEKGFPPLLYLRKTS